MSNLGKKNASTEERHQIISEWKQSGLSKKHFAEQRGLKYCTFVGWFQGEKKENPSSGFSQVIMTSGDKLFMEVVVRERTLRFYQPLPIEYFQYLLK